MYVKLIVRYRYLSTQRVLLVSIQVYDDGAPPAIGQNYTLICNATGFTDATFSWERDGTELINYTSSTLTFSPLELSDAGRYTCIVNNISSFSDYKNVTLTGTQSNNYSNNIKHYYNNITIRYFNALASVPAPVSVNFTSDKPNPIRPYGSNITLICIVELNSTANLSALMVNVTFIKNYSSLNAFSQGKMTDVATYTFTTELESFKRNSSGNYNCTVTVSPHIHHPLIDHSTVTEMVKLSTGTAT